MIDDCHLSGWSESGEVLMKSQKSGCGKLKIASSTIPND